MSLDVFILVRALTSLIVLFLNVKNVMGKKLSLILVWGGGGGANENTGAMSVGFLSIRIPRFRLSCF
jgi:hypothetical protein